MKEEARPLKSRFILHPASAIVGELRGLVQAREKGCLLAWDARDWLYLLNRAGILQGQVRVPGRLAAAACADDGSAYVAAGSQGEVWWLGPDLMTSWQRSLPGPVVAVAVDAFGQFAAIADTGGQLHVFDRRGQLAWHVQSPRPFHHLAFVPAAPYLMACADYGLVACFDSQGQWVWREGLVAHVGALAVDGYGEQIILACFSEGLLRYARTGAKHPRYALAEPCRLVSVSFDGAATLVAGVSRRLHLLDAMGRSLVSHELEHKPVAVRISALGDTATVALADGTLLELELPPR
jgi:hypothetical protein